jgi:hypothetical protein
MESDLDAHLQRVNAELHDRKQDVERLTSESKRLSQELDTCRINMRRQAIHDKIREAQEDPRGKESALRLCELFIQLHCLGGRKRVYRVEQGKKYISLWRMSGTGWGDGVKYRVNITGDVYEGKTSKRVRFNVFDDPPDAWK